ncbi:MAG: LPS export ABC transporter periplasmic protein LptC [Desulfobacterales bacterium]|nr:MAG: LPS export ABC transporter periplasmic protein LptC [Desulfobacterales bacterium]
MSRAKTVVYCLLVLTVAGIGIGLAGYLRLGEEPEALHSVLPKDCDVSLNRVHHVATRDGVKEWTLDAESAQYHKTNNKTVFKDILATFFLEDGNTIRLSSRDGVLLTDTKDMEVWGDVVARSGPYELNTDKLCYKYESHTMFTESPVIIKGNGMEIIGDRMAFDLQTEQVVVWGRVKAVFERFTL